MELIFRKAQETDLDSITRIYNDAVLNTTATFDTEIKNIENRREWLLNRDENFPALVALKNGDVIGYASLNRWSDKKAYDIIAELSIYMDPEMRGKGFGKPLLKALLQLTPQTELVSILSRITEGNDQSIYMHKQEGFKEIGVLQKCGRKFGKILDVTMMQKML